MAKEQDRDNWRSTVRPRWARGASVLGATAGLGMLGLVTAGPAAAATGVPVLEEIKQCESAGNYQAQNPSSTASGAYQFLDTTWQSLEASAGYARAADAPASVQDAAALELYTQQGTSPWTASAGCWQSSTATVSAATATTSSTASATTTFATAESTGSPASAGSAETSSPVFIPADLPAVTTGSGATSADHGFAAGTVRANIGVAGPGPTTVSGSSLLNDSPMPQECLMR